LHISEPVLPWANVWIDVIGVPKLNYFKRFIIKVVLYGVF